MADLPVTQDLLADTIRELRTQLAANGWKKQEVPVEKCQQVGCQEPRAALLHWPGRQPVPICVAHARRAENIGLAMGMVSTVVWDPNDPPKSTEEAAR